MTINWKLIFMRFSFLNSKINKSLICDRQILSLFAIDTNRDFQTSKYLTSTLKELILS